MLTAVAAQLTRRLGLGSSGILAIQRAPKQSRRLDAPSESRRVCQHVDLET